MAYYLVPDNMRANIGGHNGFQDRGLKGMGIPGYMGMRGYEGFDVPTPIGARYFPPQTNYDDDTDDPVPLAVGYKANGGRPAYRQRVFNAAKKDRKKWGLSRTELNQLGPQGYGPDWSAVKPGHKVPDKVGGGGDISHKFHLAAPGAERPDFTIFEFPAANVADAAAEEIELDQALSLAGRFGRDLLGVDTQGILETMVTEHLTITTADHEMQCSVSLQSRTGTFALSDPELLYRARWAQAETAPTTAQAETLNVQFYETVYGEPELYVAPRLFWDFSNDLDAQVNAAALDARISSMSRRLTFQLFIELLERYADVTLL